MTKQATDTSAFTQNTTNARSPDSYVLQGDNLNAGANNLSMSIKDGRLWFTEKLVMMLFLHRENKFFLSLYYISKHY